MARICPEKPVTALSILRREIFHAKSGSFRDSLGRDRVVPYRVLPIEMPKLS